MNKNNIYLLEKLPDELRHLSIEPGHKMLLTRWRLGNDVWVVLLTLMPGQKPMAWKLSPGEYYKINPKHGSRERWIRENLAPTIEAPANENKPRQLMLML